MSSPLLSLLLWAAPVRAEDAAVPLELPVDLYRAAPGSADALVTPPLLAPAGFGATADLTLGRRLLTYRLGDGPEQLLVRNAAAVHLTASWGQPRWDVGLSLPTYAHLDGELVPAGGVGALGDVGVQARAGLLPGLLSLALSATLPTATQDTMTGYGTLTGQASLIVGGRYLRAAAGYMLAPSVQIGPERADDRLLLSAQGSWSPAPDWTLSAEVWTAFSYRATTAASVPGELLLSGYRGLPAGGQLRMGLGAAILPGIGVPSARLVVGAGQVAAAAALPGEPLPAGG